MTARKLLRGALPLSLAALVAWAPVSGAIATKDRVDHAVNYLRQNQESDGRIPSSFGSAHASTADGVLSLVAAGRLGGRVERAMDWLEANETEAEELDSLGKKTKVVLAAVAAGRDPRNFGAEQRNLIEEIAATLGEDAVYDSSPFSQVWDQAYALLALEAAGASVPRRAAAWLADAQCPDGGWQFDQPHTEGENGRCKNASNPEDYTESDTNTTGVVLQALAAVRRSVTVDVDPFAWLKKRRDDVKGGWGFDRNFPLTDSASTAIVLQAYAAFDKSPPKGARAALRALQRICTGTNASGGFSRGWVQAKNGVRREAGSDLGNSVTAILGLLEEPLPIEPAPYLTPLPDALPCGATP